MTLILLRCRQMTCTNRKENMVWKNRLLGRIKYHTAENFTTDFGIRMRRRIHPFIHFIIRHAVKRPYVVKEYPMLEKGKQYIFAAGHSFPGDIVSDLAAIDRNTWVLVGTTDQLDHNPEFNVAWLNGLLFVNKFDKNSRGHAFRKMKRILENGSSVLLYPEGVLNHSENEYCRPLYPGVYYLAKETNCQVVPIVAEGSHDPQRILIAASDPLDFSDKEKEEALLMLRDALSTLRFDLCNGDLVERKTMSGDLRLAWMKKRMDVYFENRWFEPNWDEEIMSYRGP